MNETWQEFNGKKLNELDYKQERQKKTEWIERGKESIRKRNVKEM